MYREDYKNFVWYPVTDETYWVEEDQNEFPGCMTIIKDTSLVRYDMPPAIYTQSNCYIGWGTMAKSPEHYEFMIIDMGFDYNAQIEKSKQEEREMLYSEGIYYGDEEDENI